MTTYDQGLVPTVCLSENKVKLFEESTTNGKHNGGRKGSSKSTSDLISGSEARPRPPMATRSISEVRIETNKIDLSAQDSMTSDDDYDAGEL